LYQQRVDDVVTIVHSDIADDVDLTGRTVNLYHGSGREITSHPSNVRPGEHRPRSGQPAGGLAGTPQHAGVEHVRELNIIDKGTMAGQKPRGFAALQRLVYIAPHALPSVARRR
jgi:hypothetical protein